MKKAICILIITVIYSCSGSGSDNSNEVEPSTIDFDWIVPMGTVWGSFNLFPLAQNPTLSKVSEINFISDNALVAIISFENEIRVYPYQYISPFECINDTFKGNNIAMTFCPLTQSALCWNRKFKTDNFVLQSSGYLHYDNLIAYDPNSDTYWSQMLSKCIRGKYAGETNNTFNFIETNWGTVKEFFPNALTFTNSSISSKTNNTSKSTEHINGGDKVFGIINNSINNSSVHIYEYEEFIEGITIYQKFFNSQNIIVVGSKEKHFITSYIKEGNATFTSVQNSFPIVMEDSDGNKWNVFGIAQSGPDMGKQLKSPTGFVALWWAWNNFYDDFVYND